MKYQDPSSTINTPESVPSRPFLSVIQGVRSKEKDLRNSESSQIVTLEKFSSDKHRINFDDRSTSYKHFSLRLSQNSDASIFLLVPTDIPVTVSLDLLPRLKFPDVRSITMSLATVVTVD